MCAKSVTALLAPRPEGAGAAGSAAGGGDLLHELEEKMDVARLQVQIYEALNNMTGIEANEAKTRLDAELLDITTVSTSSVMYFISFPSLLLYIVYQSLKLAAE